MLESTGCAVQVIGEGTLRLDALNIDDLTRVEAYSTKVRLKSPKGVIGGGGVLHLALHFDTSYARGTEISSSAPAKLPIPSNNGVKHRALPPPTNGTAMDRTGGQGRGPAGTLPVLEEKPDESSEEEDGERGGVGARGELRWREANGSGVPGSRASQVQGQSTSDLGYLTAVRVIGTLICKHIGHSR
jgi:hypothetical protein